MSYHFRNNSWQCIIIENWVILNNLVKNRSNAACINDSGFFASVALRTVHILNIFLCLYELGLHSDVMEIGGSVGEGTECSTLNRVDTVSVETMMRPRKVIKSAQKNSIFNYLDPHMKDAFCSCGIWKVLIFLRTPSGSQSVSGHNLD